MNFLIVLVVLTTPTVSFANSATKEFNELTEILCYQEAKAFGCVSGPEEEDPVCVEKQKRKLGLNCSKLHERKK